MKVNMLEKYTGKKVNVHLKSGRKLEGVLQKTGVYTFVVEKDEFLAGSVTEIFAE
ncbi:MAG: hypothetical protein JRN32_03445 [Nitrososphaerota archaeon]|jgi:small nuclear ribonucleoprotein (snRNP)-like protein|nr:hypothetical protein [Nitrososphaerota archaeon]